MKSDIILNKISIIERCMKRVKEEYQDNPAHLHDYTKQDSIVLNIQRACEASIDMAMHIVAEYKMGLPQNSRDAFSYLEEKGVITVPLSNSLKAMVGFRNIAVHSYQELNIDVLHKIVEEKMNDFYEFNKSVLSYV